MNNAENPAFNTTAPLAASAPQHTDLNAPPAQPNAALTPGRTGLETKAQDQGNQPADSVQDPSSYPELELPQDVEFSSGALEEFKNLSREMGLSGEQVQKLLNFEASFLRSGAENGAEEKQQIVERWAEQTKAFYGARCDEEISVALRAADAFGGPQLRALLEDTGLGNHPVIVRTFNEIGKCISEDVCPGGKPAAPQDKTFAEALYGKNN